MSGIKIARIRGIQSLFAYITEHPGSGSVVPIRRCPSSHPHSATQSRPRLLAGRPTPTQRRLSFQRRLRGQLRRNKTNDMPLTKQRPPPRQEGCDLTTHHGFSQARLDRLCDSMQPLMTRHVLEAEMEKIFGEADKYVFGPVDKVPCSRSGKGKRRWFRGGCGWGGWVSGRVMRLWGFSC